MELVETHLRGLARRCLEEVSTSAALKCLPLTESGMDLNSTLAQVPCPDTGGPQELFGRIVVVAEGHADRYDLEKDRASYQSGLAAADIEAAAAIVLDLVFVLDLVDSHWSLPHSAYSQLVKDIRLVEVEVVVASPPARLKAESSSSVCEPDS